MSERLLALIACAVLARLSLPALAEPGDLKQDDKAEKLAEPPKEAIEERRRRANDAAKGDHYHAVANPAKGEKPGERGLPSKGYRPGRETARRQDKKRKREDGSSARRPSGAFWGEYRCNNSCAGVASGVGVTADAPGTST
jgi:hypothetical protein